MRLLLGLCLLFAGTGCMAARNVRPVGEGKVATGLSVGGPMFTNLGGAIPTPLMTAYGRYGLNARTDLDFGLSVPIVGAAGVDVGAARLVLEQDGAVPAVMVGGRLNLWGNLYALSGKKDPNGRDYAFGPRVFEEAYGYASWKLGQSFLVYAGLDLFVQAEKANFRPTLLAGGEWRANKLFGLQAELKQMAFTTDGQYAAVSFIGPGSYGALAFNLGFNFYPGAEEL